MKTWALRAGALAFLRKPVGKGALLRFIPMALENAKHATRLAKENKRFWSGWTSSPQFPSWMTFLARSWWP